MIDMQTTHEQLQSEQRFQSKVVNTLQLYALVRQFFNKCGQHGLHVNIPGPDVNWSWPWRSFPRRVQLPVRDETAKLRVQPNHQFAHIVALDQFYPQL